MKCLFRFFKDDSAQATTEYILLLAVIVGMIIVIFKKLFGPYLVKIFGNIGDSMDTLLFKNFHSFPVGR